MRGTASDSSVGDVVRVEPFDVNNFRTASIPGSTVGSFAFHLPVALNPHLVRVDGSLSCDFVTRGMVADSCVADGDLHFPPCRTCVSPVDRLPAVLHSSSHLSHWNDADNQLPATLYFPSGRTCMSSVDEMPFCLPDFDQ